MAELPALKLERAEFMVAHRHRPAPGEAGIDDVAVRRPDQSGQRGRVR